MFGKFYSNIILQFTLMSSWSVLPGFPIYTLLSIFSLTVVRSAVQIVS